MFPKAFRISPGGSPRRRFRKAVEIPTATERNEMKTARGTARTRRSIVAAIKRSGKPAYLGRGDGSNGE
jgi:hypothetical protein